jgi:hypothetical protein
MAFKRNMALLPPSSTAIADYSRYRIPRPAVPMEGETPPGLICWGTVGNLPSPQALPTVDFNVKKKETKRQERPVRIENPDDPSQYIMVKRADQIVFGVSQLQSSAGPNTQAATPPGINDYDPARIKSFQPAAAAEQRPRTTTEVVEYKYDEVPP